MRIDTVFEGWMQYIRQDDDFTTIAVLVTRTDDHTRVDASSVQNTNSKSVECGFAGVEAVQHITCGLAIQRCFSKHVSSSFLY